MINYKIYSDGASYNNGKKDPTKDVYGSCCTLIVDDKDNILHTKVNLFKDVTNNYVEMVGAMYGINKILDDYRGSNEQVSVEVISDSEYVVKGANERIKKWRVNGWKDYSGKPIKNKDLWLIMSQLILSRPNIQISFRWHRGHKGKKVTLEQNSDTYFNEMCDSLAGKAIKEKIISLDI